MTVGTNLATFSKSADCLDVPSLVASIVCYGESKVKSKLDSIAGVGPAKRKALLKRFGSVKGVAAASVEELSSTPGISPELAQEILRELQ